MFSQTDIPDNNGSWGNKNSIGNGGLFTQKARQAIPHAHLQIGLE
jgi:hypothetical protein